MSELLTTEKPLNEDELMFVTFVNQRFLVTGGLPSKELMFEEYGINPLIYDKYINSVPVRKALAERGIDVDRYLTTYDDDTSWKAKTLTPLQLVVANTMLDLIDTKSQKKKLQDLNVSTSTYNAWLKDPAFAAYLKERAEAMLGENQHEAHLALLDKIRSGDLKAIEYYNEMTGRYVRESSKPNSGTNVAVDVNNLLVRLLEIIEDEVDQETGLRISERIMGLMTRQAVASELMNPSDPIVIPEVAKPRELTPKLQKLIDKGEGYE